MKKIDPLEFFKNQAKSAAEYFHNWLYTGVSGFDHNGEPIGKPLYCELYDIFDERAKAADPDETKIYHNCIGCNLSEGARHIDYFLRTNQDCTNIEYYIHMYSLLMYTMAERVRTIYEEIGAPYSPSQFPWENYPALQQIKQWANLFKHPKAYMLLHHPTYHIATDPDAPNFMINRKIDQDFVNRFYKAGANNAELRSLLANVEDAKVFFPDLVQLTEELCKEFEKVKDVILTDENAKSKLDQFTTVSFDLEPKENVGVN